MQKKALIKDYTSGNLPVQLLTFSVPFMISNALQVVYSIVDMIVVGQVLGSPGLSAVSTASQLINFLTMVCVGLTTGSQVYISQLVGAGKRDKLNRTIGTQFTAIAAASLVMTLIPIFFCEPVLRMMKTPEESFEMAKSYLYICGGGLIFTYGYNTVSAILRGMGNSKHPCIFIIISAGVNLVLDIVFVVFFKWGVAGAAVATILGQAVSLIWSFVFLFRKKEEFGFDFALKSFIPEKEALKKFISLGIPFALRSASVNISMMFVTALVNGVSVDASAVFGIGLKVDDTVNKISMGLNYSVSTFTGQNVAANNYERAKRSVYWAWIYCFIIYGIFTVVYLTNIEFMFRLFTSEQKVLDLAPVFVSAIIWCFPAMALMRGTNGFIQGIGNTMLSLLFAVFDGFVLRIGLSWLFGIAFDMGLFGFFLGYGLATYGTAVPGMIYFFSGKWKAFVERKLNK
ncbi:MAG: MATE family efflux transporter [Ruminococcaceae bacterium]|nr:MATE family efflux transporter [Oscillospiraceae bacterium]